MRRLIAFLALALVVGCRPAGPATKTSDKHASTPWKHAYSPGSEPTVGSTVILPRILEELDARIPDNKDEAFRHASDSAIAELWLYRSVGGLRRGRELSQADKLGSPEWRDLVDRREGRVRLFGGELVEVLEIGPDYVGIVLLKDRDGKPKDVHGYIGRWW
jgi:hypothetical protein